MENVSAHNVTTDLPVVAEPNQTAANLYRLIVYIIIFLFGVPGNGLILRVYWIKTRKTSTHVLIMALAWADFTVCFLRIRRIAIHALLLAQNEAPQVLYYIRPFELAAVATSVMLTAAIAADRYDCICRPQRRFFTHRRGKIAALIVLVYSSVTSVPSAVGSQRLLELAFQTLSFVIALVMIALCYGKVYATIRRHVRVGAVSGSAIRDAGGADNNRSTRPRIVEPSIGEATTSTVNTVSTSNNNPSTCSNVHIIDTKSVASSSEADSTKQDPGGQLATRPAQITKPKGSAVEPADSSAVNGYRHSHPEPGSVTGRVPQGAKAVVLQRKTTRMLFITSVVFLLSWLPYWIYIFLEFASFGGASIDAIKEASNQLIVMLYVNNAVNPLIYGLANRRFRQDCREVLNKIKMC